MTCRITKNPEFSLYPGQAEEAFMNTTIVAFFNNKGGVGKTSLVYHLAWMYSDLGFRVVAADLDPQAPSF
jgi:Mrp family chromosome partitioning ATPase